MKAAFRPLINKWGLAVFAAKPYVRPVGAVAIVGAMVLAGMSFRSPRVHADDGNNDESKIQQGLAIAPVPLNLKGKDRALVGLGSYIVNAQADCNGCHTLNPGVEYTPPGNPYLLAPPVGPFGGKVVVDPTTYLAGGRDFGPFPDSSGIPHLYSRNLTPDHTGLPEGGHTFSDFMQIMRHGRDFDLIHPSCTGTNTPSNCLEPPFDGNVLQVMPWPTHMNMTDRDLLAIYTYLSAVPCNPGPAGLDPKLYQQNVCK